MARRYGYDKMWLERDANNDVRAVNKAREGWPPIFVFFDDIRQLSLSFNRFHFSHVKRGWNIVAYLVSRWDTRICEELVCIEPIPQSLITLTEFDLQSYVPAIIELADICTKVLIKKKFDF